MTEARGRKRGPFTHTYAEEEKGKAGFPHKGPKGGTGKRPGKG